MNDATAIPPITTNSATGLLGRNFFAKNQHRQRRAAEQERRAVRLAEMAEKHVHAFPEIAVADFHAEEFRQLRARENQRHAGLESQHHAFRNEVHRRARARQPRDKGDRRREQRGAGGERGEARRDRRRPCCRATNR